MRELNRLEMMAVRISLEIESSRLIEVAQMTRDPHSRAGLQLRINTVTRLLRDLAPGAIVTVCVTGER
jgi:hypothetical protein